jgi:hypothetical protein
MIAANNGHVVALGNISVLSPWLSDALCRLSTGGGFSTRTLYENDEETIFYGVRPVILNGIDVVAERSDLLDRSLLINLPIIPEDRRRPEAELWGAFERARPRIIGALLDAVSTAIRRLPETKIERLPRMADFALWAASAEPALGLPEGCFLDTYRRNRADAHSAVIDHDQVAIVLLAMLDQPAQAGCWEGTSAELLERLDTVAGHDAGKKRPDGWPKSPRGISGAIKRLAPNLRAAGIVVQHGQTAGTRSRKLLRIRRDRDSIDATDATDAPTQNHGENASVAASVANPDRRTQPTQNAGKSVDASVSVDCDGSNPTCPNDDPNDLLLAIAAEEREDWEG